MNRLPPLSRIPSVSLAPAPGETEEHRAARRWIFATAFVAAALLGAAAGLIDSRVLP